MRCMVYVMSDIHGNMRRFRSVMDKIKLKKTDTLYILGDVIDRHPHGIELLQEIMKAPNMKMLLGNHEMMMVNTLCPGKTPWRHIPDRDDAWIWCRHNGGYPTREAFDELPKKEQKRILDFIKSLPINLDVDVNGEQYKLVHAAPLEYFKGKYEWKYEDKTEFAVWDRGWIDESVWKNGTVICGHTPTIHLNDTKRLEVVKLGGQNIIDIDCGSGFPDYDKTNFPYQGRLACVCLDTGKVFYSDEPTDGGFPNED